MKVKSINPLTAKSGNATNGKDVATNREKGTQANMENRQKDAMNHVLSWKKIGETYILGYVRECKTDQWNQPID